MLEATCGVGRGVSCSLCCSNADKVVVARQVGLSNRAMELFDWLRGLEPSHDLAALCDVYTCGPNPALRP